MLTFFALVHMVELRHWCGEGGSDGNIPRYAIDIGSVVGMLTFLALVHMVDAIRD